MAKTFHLDNLETVIELRRRLMVEKPQHWIQTVSAKFLDDDDVAATLAGWVLYPCELTDERLDDILGDDDETWSVLHEINHLVKEHHCIAVFYVSGVMVSTGYRGKRLGARLVDAVANSLPLDYGHILLQPALFEESRSRSDSVSSKKRLVKYWSDHGFVRHGPTYMYRPADSRDPFLDKQDQKDPIPLRK